MSNVVPEGWKDLKFGDLANMHKGLTYASSNYSDKENGSPFITLKCIKKSGGFSEVGLKYYDGKYKPSHVVDEGDVVFANTDLTRDGDVVGSPLQVPYIACDRPKIISMDLSKVVPKDGVNKGFLYYWLKTPAVKRYMINFSAGSTVLHLNLGSVSSIPVLTPPLPEQRKIATILSSVDDVIEKTQAQIDKLKDLKTGMMQELLTKGIGHTEFKDSPVGRIPVGWDVESIGEVARLTSGGTPSRENSNYWNGNIPWVKTGEIKYLTIYQTEEHISDEGMKNSSAKLVPPGSVLMAMYGQGVTRGKVAILGVESTMNQACLAIIPKDNLHNMFLYHFLTNEYENLRSLVQEGAQKNLNATIVKDVLIPIPPASEQVKIFTALSSIDKKIDIVNSKLTSLCNIKKALMQDLLTGKVRVSVN